MSRAAVRLGLGRRYRDVLSYAGLIWLLTALVLAAPLALLPFHTEDAELWWRVLLPALALGLPGYAAWRWLAPRGAPTLSISEAAAVVIYAWVGAIAAGTLSFVLLTDLTVLQALFEATSGFTTTGLSVVDVTRASSTVLLLRSLTEYAGGAGLAILMVSLLSAPLGIGLSVAEGRGEQLVANVVHSAKIIVRMYAAYAALGTVALRVAGMSWFDAVNHAMAAVSTGGFSTRVESIGYWDSAAVEAVTIVLMLLGTTNFLVAWALLRGRWRVALGSGEFRLMAVLLPLSWAFMIATGIGALYPGLGRSMRVVVFETVSALSTTGFSTVGYGEWPTTGWLVLVLLMMIGGGIGSTAGGLKQARVYILWRTACFEVRRSLLPQQAVNQPRLHAGEHLVFLGDAEVRRTAAFLFVYLVVFAAGVGVMVTSGIPLASSLFEMASTLGTVGLSVGVTAPDAPGAVLGAQVVAMILGRLEFFVVLVGLSRLALDAGHLAGSYVHRSRT